MRGEKAFLLQHREHHACGQRLSSLWSFGLNYFKQFIYNMCIEVVTMSGASVGLKARLKSSNIHVCSLVCFINHLTTRWGFSPFIYTFRRCLLLLENWTLNCFKLRQRCEISRIDQNFLTEKANFTFTRSMELSRQNWLHWVVAICFILLFSDFLLKSYQKKREILHRPLRLT